MKVIYLVLKVVAKLAHLVAIIGGHVTAQFPPIVKFITKHNSILSKALIMPLTIWNRVCLINKRISSFSVQILLFFQEITFITEFPGCKLSATHIFNRWQMGFFRGQICYLLLNSDFPPQVLVYLFILIILVINTTVTVNFSRVILHTSADSSDPDKTAPRPLQGCHL